MIDGNRIQALMKSKDLNQQDCADRLGIPLRTFGAYKRNECDCPTDILCRIADLFGVSTDYLLGRTEEQAPPVHKAIIYDHDPDTLKHGIDVSEIVMFADLLRDVVQSAILGELKKSHPNG